MSEALRQDIEHLSGSPVSNLRRLHGGDLSDVFVVGLADGRRLVAKSGAHVSTEADMLQAIASAGARAPVVIATGGTVILLEHLEETESSEDGWRDLGQHLRVLHDGTGEAYGWQEDYAFGAVPIRNAQTKNWCQFWAENRLLDGLSDISVSLAKRLEALTLRLNDFIPDNPPLSLLHGDLWAGNVLFSGKRAYLIDPACCYGHNEVDLAMLTLFASPPEAFWQSYGTPEAGFSERRTVYQLWPALVHLRLFGTSYRNMVEQRLAALGF